MTALKILCAAATACTLLAAPAAAQYANPGVASNVGTSRGVDMDPQDRTVELPPHERIARGVFNYSVERAAAAARKTAELGSSRPAKAAEVKVGRPVYDIEGTLTALVEAVEPDGAVLYNGLSNVKVPLDAFGVNKKGLLLQVTKEQFDRQVLAAYTPTRR